LVILCGGFTVLQAPVFDGVAFDLLPFDQDGLAAPEVDVGGGEIAQALVVAAMVENRIEAPVVEALRVQGHEINLIDPFSMSCRGMQAISRDRETGVLNGAADSRRDGAAIAL
jgi:hypothetical protein